MCTAGERRCTCKHVNSAQKQLVPQAFIKIIQSNACMMYLVLLLCCSSTGLRNISSTNEGAGTLHNNSTLIYGQQTLKVITSTKHTEDVCAQHIYVCMCETNRDSLSVCVLEQNKFIHSTCVLSKVKQSCFWSSVTVTGKEFCLIVTHKRSWWWWWWKTSKLKQLMLTFCLLFACFCSFCYQLFIRLFFCIHSFFSLFTLCLSIFSYFKGALCNLFCSELTTYK